MCRPVNQYKVLRVPFIAVSYAPLEKIIPPDVILPRSLPNPHTANSHDPSVALQHAVHEISERSPVVSSAGQAVFINEQHVLLEARVQMWLQAELADHRVMVAIYVRIDTIHALEDLAH